MGLFQVWFFIIFFLSNFSIYGYEGLGTQPTDSDYENVSSSFYQDSFDTTEWEIEKIRALASYLYYAAQSTGVTFGQMLEVFKEPLLAAMPDAPPQEVKTPALKAESIKMSYKRKKRRRRD